MLKCRLLRSNAIPVPEVGYYATPAQFSTADRPGGSSEVAQGTPLLPQPSSALPPQPTLLPGAAPLMDTKHSAFQTHAELFLLRNFIFMSVTAKRTQKTRHSGREPTAQCDIEP